MIRKGYDLLGLAQRAGKVVSGDAAVEANLLKGNGELVIIASDASKRTRDNFLRLTQESQVTNIIVGEKVRLGTAIGKSPRSVLCIIDRGFAQRIQELFQSEGTE